MDNLIPKIIAVVVVVGICWGVVAVVRFFTNPDNYR